MRSREKNKTKKTLMGGGDFFGYKTAKKTREMDWWGVCKFSDGNPVATWPIPTPIPPTVANFEGR